MTKFLLACLPAFLGTEALAADFDPERRVLFISILEANDCRMNNFEPAAEILDAIATNKFTRDEVRAIGTDLLATDDAERQGDHMVLKTENCS